MRFVGFLVFLLICIFIGHSLYQRRQADTQLQAALHVLPNEPGVAYKAMKPVFESSNFVTLGKSDAAISEFLDAARDKTIGLINSPQLNKQMVETIGWNLGLFADAKREYNTPVEAHQTAIATALVGVEQRMQSRQSLEAWDAYIAMAAKALDAGQIPASAIPDSASWLSRLNQTDRWEIAIREAEAKAAAGLAAGVTLLGKTPAATPADPEVAFLDRAYDDGELIEADKAFQLGLIACRRPTELFKQAKVPPELLTLKTKIDFNLAAIRMLHITQLKAKSSIESAYVVHLVLNPSNDAIPSSGELYASFVNMENAEIDRIAELLDSLPAAPTLRFLAARAQGQYWSLMGSPSKAQLGGQRLTIARATVAPQVESLVNASPNISVILR